MKNIQKPIALCYLMVAKCMRLNLIKNIPMLALCSLLGMSTAYAKAPSPERLIQGKWQSLNEKGVILEVGGKTWSTYNIGEKKPVRDTFAYQVKCEDGSKKACFAVMAKFDITYYHILSLQKQRVKLQEGQRIHSFKKLK